MDNINITESNLGTKTASEVLDFFKNGDMGFQTGKDYILYSGKVEGTNITEILGQNNNFEYMNVAHTNTGKLAKKISLNTDDVGFKFLQSVTNDFFKERPTFSSLNGDEKKLVIDTAKYLAGAKDAIRPTDARFEKHFGDAEPMWDTVSRRFVAEAPSGTNFRILTGTDGFDMEKLNDTVLMREELPALFARDDVQINGQDISKYHLGSLDDFKFAVYSDSSAQTLLAYKNGTIDIELLKNLEDPDFAKQYLNGLSEADQARFHHALNEVSDEFKALHGSSWHVPDGVLKGLKALSMVGVAVGFSLAAQEAKAAEAAGDSERARDIMLEWAVTEAGSEIISTAATFIVGVAAVAIPAVSAPVAAVIGIAAGIAAGIYGEDFVKDLYNLTKDLDHNGRMDLLDRIGTVLFGQDFTPNQIPDTLKEMAVTLQGEMSLADFISKAKADIAYRYALRELNPFVAEGADHQEFNDDHSLDLFSLENPNGMTDNYIKDRAEMLILQMRYLKHGLKLGRDLVDDMVNEDWDYQDYGKHPFAGAPDDPLLFSIDGNGIMADNHIIAFGTAGDDSIDGGGRSDHLYGLKGEDVLNGKGGNDYLEGGVDFDTYIIQDKDTVFDADMKGKLVFHNRIFSDLDLSDARFVAIGSSSWQLVDENGEPDASVIAIRGGNGNDNDLVIYRSGDQAVIKDFFVMAQHASVDGGEQWSGLSLTLAPAPVPESALANSTPSSDGYHLQVQPNKYAQIYGGAGKENWVFGSEKGDVMFFMAATRAVVDGGDGKDRIFGSNFADEIHGGADNDVINGASGLGLNLSASETVADKDLLFGGSGHDAIAGVGGDDVIYGDTPEAVLAPSESGTQGNWLLGNKGNDHLFGAAGDDFLNGGEGSDVIQGGGGDDVILGDGDVRFATKFFSYVDTSISTPIYTPALPAHPLIPPGVNVSYPTPSGRGISIEYRVENDQWKAEGNSNIYTLHRYTSDWTLSIDKETGDYKIAYNNNALKITDNHHIVSADGARDYLYGGAGNDLIIGQTGDDFLFGEDGDDILWGDDNRDLTGVIGNDVLIGGAGNDTLYGGGGHDELYGGSGSDTLKGGDGSDSYYFSLDDFKTADIDIVDDFGDNRAENGGAYDLIYLDNQLLFDYNWAADANDKMRWIDEKSGYVLTREGDRLVISHQDDAGRVYVKNYQDGDYGLRLLANRAPKVAETLSEIQGDTDTALDYTFADNLFHDADGDVLNYRVEGLPAGLVFDAASRTIHGTAAQAGEYSLQLIADDGKGGTASQTIALHIIARNHTPEVAEIISEIQGDTDTALNYTFADNLFHDADGDVLNYRVEGLPAGLVFDAASRTIHGTAVQAGEYSLQLIADDGKGGTASQSIALHIAHINHAPEAVQTLPAQTLHLRDAWQWQLPAEAIKDADGDALHYQLGENAPSWLSISADGLLKGTPSEAGNYSISILVDDGQGGKAETQLDIVVQKPDAITVHDGFTLASFGDDVVYGGMQADSLHGLTGDDLLFGWEGDDYLAGNLGNDTLHGGEGHDHLVGGFGNDQLFGETGNDLLEGGFGDDIYHYARGYGHDTIRESGGNDTLILQDFYFSELIVSHDKDALNLAFADNADDKITIEKWDSWFGSGKIETIQLADTKLNAKQLEHYADGKSHTAADLQRDFGIEII